MFLAGHRIHLCFQHSKRFDDLGSSLMWFDYIVNESALGSDKRRGETFPELIGFLAASSGVVRSGGKLPLVDDIDRALGPHDGDLRRWIREIDIRPKML